MNEKKHGLPPMGKEVVRQYEKHAGTPHGRLRHDLLFMYYRKFLESRDIDLIIDVGGGSGMLVERLLDSQPELRAVLIDADRDMVEQAKRRLAPNRKTNRTSLIVGTAGDFPRIFSSLEVRGKKILTAFNHTIEYISGKREVLEAIRSAVPQGSFLGIMYLNNSHEAMRKLMFNDSPEGVLDQLRSYRLDMVYFGLAKAADTHELDSYFLGSGGRLLEEYGIRTLSDLKPRDFVETNYQRILDMEFALGKMSDFIGLARYRLKIFGV